MPLQVGELHVIRFILGGHKVITSVSFAEIPGSITLTGFFLRFQHHLDTILLRTPEDWGWFGRIATEMIEFSTFDLSRGYLNYTGCLLYDSNGARRPLEDLTSPLKSDPVNGLYS